MLYEHTNTRARARVHTPLHFLCALGSGVAAPHFHAGKGCALLNTYTDVILVMQVVNTVDRIVARAVRVILAARGIFDVELRRVLPVRARRADLWEVG